MSITDEFGRGLSFFGQPVQAVQAGQTGKPGQERQVPGPSRILTPQLGQVGSDRPQGQPGQPGHHVQGGQTGQSGPAGRPHGPIGHPAYSQAGHPAYNQPGPPGPAQNGILGLSQDDDLDIVQAISSLKLDDIDPPFHPFYQEYPFYNYQSQVQSSPFQYPYGFGQPGQAHPTHTGQTHPGQPGQTHPIHPGQPGQTQPVQPGQTQHAQPQAPPGHVHPGQGGGLFNPVATPVNGEWNAPDYSMWNKQQQQPPYRRYTMNVHRKQHRRKPDDSNKYVNCKLEDFSGDIYSLCKDQHGCRFLQRQLDENSDVSATLIFNEIYLKIVDLMTDPFGNYLIQKLLEKVNPDQRTILVKNSAPEFIRIALDPHGTRALQKLVECILTEEERLTVVNALSPYVVQLSRDLNGNHVVQTCLQKLEACDNQFIFDAASANCVEIATHRHGCCVLQRCLDHGDYAQRSQLSLKVAENAETLSIDPFGNYVVQYVLSRGDDHLIDLITTHIKKNVIPLSLHKFGLNVIEKLLRITKLSPALVEVLLQNENRFGEMLNDPFGNYVLQTALDVGGREDLEKLERGLEPLLGGIRSTPHGRRILMKLTSANPR